MASYKKRLLKLIIGGIAVVVIGLLYAILGNLIGHYVPCLFHEVTGLKCPGCGMTRMCRALLELDFKSAFYYNKAVFLLLPYFCFLTYRYGVRYIKEGTFRVSKKDEKGLWLVIAVLVSYSIIRNIVPLPYF